MGRRRLSVSKATADEPSPRLGAVAIYVVTLLGLLAMASESVLTGHTAFNHHALLAESWLHGRLDLGGPPPTYTQYNDFALKDGLFYVSFPPFPAVLLLPLVALSGSAAATRDGLFFIAVAASTPALLHLALERLTKTGLSSRTHRENAALSLLFAFGSVYFFTAVQGTVWFASHVVGAACAAGYLYASIGAGHPILAGLALGLAVATRTPLAFAAPLFVLEVVRTTRGDLALAGRRLCAFFAPLVLIGALLAWHNRARFGDPFEFGHRYLDVVWQPRIQRWGLFSLHYLGRNLGVALAGMPFFGSSNAPFQVSPHGLALWITSPYFAWALWPRPLKGARSSVYRALAACALLVALVDLLYQNTGWVQFGYRFSNDYSVFVIALIALGRRRLGALFWVAGAAAVIVNLFGAATFQRPGYEKYYARTGVTVVHEPD